MDPTQRLTADIVVNSYPTEELGRVIRLYGEERYARRIADAITRARPLEDTLELAEVVRNAIPAATRRTGGHPAKRTFQALRIEVNRELDALESVLPQTVNALSVGGRVAALTYHSLEDRLVKRFFAERARDCTCPPGFPVCTCGARAELRVLTRKGIKATEAEARANPRSTSARLRVAERLGSPEDVA
jgi:16S rRNA (cytosine1402-N4)-methyltransferase